MREETITLGTVEIDEGMIAKGQNNIIGKLLKKGAAINLLGFLLGRASILGGITPFGTAFYAAMSGTRANMLSLLLSINFGLITVGISGTQIKYIIASLVYSLLNVFRPLNLNKNINVAVRTFLCVFVVGFIITLYKGLLLYDLILNIFEAFMAFILVLLFRNVVTFFNSGIPRPLTNEQTISITILGVLALTGISDFTIFGLTLRNVLIISLIIIFALRNGAGTGAAIGVITGLIVSMSTSVTALVVGAYGFCGLIAGVFKDLGKIGSILGFVLANAIITIYMNGSTEVLINLAEIIGAAAIVLLIPGRIITNINDYFIRPSLAYLEKKSKIEKVKDITTNRLKEFADTFGQLASTFNKISEKNININKDDVATLFEEVAERVCKPCGLNTNCWNKEFYTTYQSMFSMLEKLEQKGAITNYDAPVYFRDKCIRLEEFINKTNLMYELYNVNFNWQKKITESRALIAQQLDGVSKVINTLAGEIEADICFKNELENQIMRQLLQIGIELEEVMVIENKNGKYEISIAHKTCENNRVCASQIIPTISKIVKRNMVKEDVMCALRDDTCIIKLCEKQNYRILTAIASVSKIKNNICGDNYSFIQLKDGKFIAALSDGMGYGDKASQESKATLTLLEKFMRSGFDKDLSIKLINSVLILKSTQESFSTIDLSIIDLFTGEVEFTKIGAASTFIKRKNKVEFIKSTSLPVGILNKVDIELTCKKMEDGDVIIMVSDGVLDSKKDAVRKEDWLREELNKIDVKSPQEIADFIMEKARDNYQDEQEDDMTVLVAKVSETI